MKMTTSVMPPCRRGMVIVGLFASVLLWPDGVHAQFSYTVRNGVVTITEYTGPANALTIPAKIEGRAVSAIGAYAFHGCTNLAYLVLPDSLTSIGDHAFEDCTSLTNIAIPSNVIYLGNGAFQNCRSLQAIAIPNTVTQLGGYTFFDCVNLRSATVPDAITSIGEYAFYNCSSLENLRIPTNVTLIGDFAFCNCHTVTSLTVPVGVSDIADGLFKYCISLTNATILADVTSVGSEAFSGCSHLTDVYFAGDTPSVGSYVFMNSPKAIVHHFPATIGWEAMFAGRPTALWNLPGQIHIVTNAYSVGEYIGTMTVTVKRVNGAYGAASCLYTTANGTAFAPSDFTAVSGALTWTNGDYSPRTIAIAIADDGTSDGDKGFSIALSGVTGANVDDPVSATVTIRDNEFSALRINSGGGEAGDWGADTGYLDGSTLSGVAAVSGAGSVPQAVYQTSRSGLTVTYNLQQVPDGKYRVRLHWAELYKNAKNKRKFNVSLEGDQVLSSFDVFTAAGGRNKAVVREFAASVSGGLQVTATATADSAMLSGIEVLPVAPAVLVTPDAVTVPEGSSAVFAVCLSDAPTGTVEIFVQRTSGDPNVGISGAAALVFTPANWNVSQQIKLCAAEDADDAAGQTTLACSANGYTAAFVAVTERDNDVPPYSLRLNCGGGAAGDWAADAGYSGGRTQWTQQPITDIGTVPMAVYQAQRTDKTLYYDLTQVPDGQYLVRLHFAETTLKSANRRKFNVSLEGVQVLSSFDVFAAAGGVNRAVVREFVANVSGGLQLYAQATLGTAVLCGIEILPSAGSCGHAMKASTSVGTADTETSETARLVPDDILTSVGEMDSNKWQLVDDDTNTVWQGIAGMPSEWIAFTYYGDPVMIRAVEIACDGEAPTNTTLLGSCEAQSWFDVRDALNRKQPAMLKYLWVIIPADEKGLLRDIRDIRVIPAE